MAHTARGEHRPVPSRGLCKHGHKCTHLTPMNAYTLYTHKIETSSLLPPTYNPSSQKRRQENSCRAWGSMSYTGSSRTAWPSELAPDSKRQKKKSKGKIKMWSYGLAKCLRGQSCLPHKPTHTVNLHSPNSTSNPLIFTLMHTPLNPHIQDK